jgi:multiple sugar transport system substrate-binding protein
MTLFSSFIAQWMFKPLKCAIPSTRWLLIGVLLVAGCGGRKNASRMPDGRIPVRVYLMLINPTQVGYYKWAEKEYEKRHPDTDIIIEQFPGSSLKDYEIKLRLRFASNDAPDVIHSVEAIAAFLSRKGLLAEAPSYIKDRVENNSLNEMIRKAPYFNTDKLYGIATDVASVAMYYNKKHFREAGLDPEKPPKTWDELLYDAEKLTKRDAYGNPTRAGLFVRKIGFKPGTAEKWLTFFVSAGGEVFNKDGTEVLIDSQAGRDALNLYKTVLFDKKIDSVKLEGDQIGFGLGNVSILYRELHVRRWLKQTHPEIEFGVANLPVKVRSMAMAGTYMFSVSDMSPNKAQAWRFVEFTTSDEAYSKYCDPEGCIPTFKSVDAMPKYKNDKVLQVFASQKLYSLENFPDSPRALELLGAYIEKFCYGELTVDQTLADATRDMNALLGRNKKP